MAGWVNEWKGGRDGSLISLRVASEKAGYTHRLDDRRRRERFGELDEGLDLALEDQLVVRGDTLRVLGRRSRRRGSLRSSRRWPRRRGRGSIEVRGAEGRYRRALRRRDVL